MNLTAIQWMAISVLVLGALSTSNAQLIDLFGPLTAKTIGSAAVLGTTILGAVLGFLGGQTGQLKAVQAMPGVDKIVVNEKANPTLAKAAVDEDNPKIEAKPSAQQVVSETAKDA